MQHDALQQGAVHGEDPQQDLRPLPAEEVQQVREVHRVSGRRGAVALAGSCTLAFVTSASHLRDNILVLDVFFEALNYETIEQKKAYEVAGLLGAFSLTVSIAPACCCSLI